MPKAQPKPSRKPLVTKRPALPSARRAKQRWSVIAAAGGLALVAVALASLWYFRNDAPATEVAAPTAAPGNSSGAAAAARSLVPDMVGAPLQVFPAGSVHVVGKERFAVGLMDEQGKPFEQGTTDFLVFTLANNQGTLTETLPAPFEPYGIEEGHEADHDHGSAITGVFVAQPTFTKPGPWGIVVRVTLPDGTKRAGQADFTVDADTPVPGPGEPAVASTTLTASDPEGAKKICTADPPDIMHAVSLDAALKLGEPTVVLFATPLLCASRTCGPSLEAVAELQRRYGDQATFIHVEIYPERDGSKPVAAMDEWQLPSEPWLFLVDAQGKIVERFEGGIGLTETEPAVQRLVGATARAEVDRWAQPAVRWA